MKFHHCLLILFITFFFSCTSQRAKQIEPHIIPKPLSEIMKQGIFILDKNTNIVTVNQLSTVSDYFESYLKETFRLELSQEKRAKEIVFKIDKSITNEEGYELEIKKNKISITSRNAKGAFYAVQSLLQLLPIKTTSKSIAIQCLEIKDAPRFSYRGMHLDVARHFFSVAFIKKYINLHRPIRMKPISNVLTTDSVY